MRSGSYPISPAVSPSTLLTWKMACASTARPYVNRDARDSFMMAVSKSGQGDNRVCAIWLVFSLGSNNVPSSPYLYQVDGNISWQTRCGAILEPACHSEKGTEFSNLNNSKNGVYIGYPTPNLAQPVLVTNGLASMLCRRWLAGSVVMTMAGPRTLTMRNNLFR